jgi:oxygen-dependent protoporphyrinogen oxidase
VGGGITGLSAAWEAACTGAARVTLLERDGRWGGKIVTDRLIFDDGGRPVTLLLDGGPESFITRKPAAWELAGELGLQDSVQKAGSETSNIFVLDGGLPKPVPISPGKFIGSTLISNRAKLRLLAEPLVPARRDMADESLASFVSRRLGSEALDKFVGPILGGIYNTDPVHQSIMTTSPVMREMERDHGGLFVATVARGIAKARKRKALAAQGQSLPPSFMAFADGSQVLVDRLVARLEAMPHVHLQLHADVAAIARDERGYTVSLVKGETLVADALILATPANIAAQLVDGVDPESAARLHAIRHVNIGTISLVYRRSEFDAAVEFSGLMIPRSEHRAIDAVTVTSARFPDRIPQEYAVVRVFFGGSAPHIMALDDVQLRAAVQGELRMLLGIRAKPIEWTIQRWPNTYPQADVGHLERVAEIEAGLPAGLYVTGGAYRGLGVPDCVGQGRATARAVVERLQAHLPLQANA